MMAKPKKRAQVLVKKVNIMSER